MREIDEQILSYWHHILSLPEFQKGLSSVYLPQDMTWHFDLTKMDVIMEDAFFKSQKLTYLKKKYPMDNLGPEGCIASVDGNHIHYRKVDPFRGLIADLVYFQYLGFKKIKITGEDYCCRIHVNRVACVYPHMFKFYGPPDFKDATLAKGVWRAIGYRQKRLSHDTHGMSKIMNLWFEQLNGSPRVGQKARDYLGSKWGFSE